MQILHLSLPIWLDDFVLEHFLNFKFSHLQQARGQEVAELFR